MKTYVVDTIGLDKGGYLVNIFLISPRKHMLWYSLEAPLSHENICCGYSLEAPQQGTSNEYHNICFRGEIRKISILLD